MLRDYQLKSVDLIRQEFQKGNRKTLLHLATGAGKTTIFCHIASEARQRGKNILVITRGRKIVDQASKRMFRERVEHGVYMAGHWAFCPRLPVQVASIDTLLARDERPKADLIIVDEAHLFSPTSKSGQLFKSYPDAYVLAVTATPYVAKGLRHLADSIVHPITFEELITQGYLVPFRYFVPSEPDLADVQVSSTTHDYVTEQLEGAMMKNQLSGKIVDHWKKLAEGRPTVCFAVNIKHSKILAEKFRVNGVAAEHCDADTSDAEREQIIKRLEDGTTKVICNVGVLSLGVDIPVLGAIIMARPTRSRNLFIQQAGRGTRTFAGKSNCILLDHAGNIRLHGLPTDEPDVDLDGKLRKAPIRETKICPQCFAAFRGAICAECGVTVPDKLPKVEPSESDEELRELVMNGSVDPVFFMYQRLLREAKQKGRKVSWAHYRLIERYGFESAMPYLPAWFVKFYETSMARL